MGNKRFSSGFPKLKMYIWYHLVMTVTGGRSPSFQKIRGKTSPKTVHRCLEETEVPDSWDSEEEEKTGRKRPDVSGAKSVFIGSLCES